MRRTEQLPILALRESLAASRRRSRPTLEADSGCARHTGAVSCAIDDARRLECWGAAVRGHTRVPQVLLEGSLLIAHFACLLRRLTIVTTMMFIGGCTILNRVLSMFTGGFQCIARCSLPLAAACLLRRAPCRRGCHAFFLRCLCNTVARPIRHDAAVLGAPGSCQLLQPVASS